MVTHSEGDKYHNVPLQENTHECQHVENGACVKCRFPFTFNLYLKKVVVKKEN